MGGCNSGQIYAEKSKFEPKKADFEQKVLKNSTISPKILKA